jgi:integrase
MYNVGRQLGMVPAEIGNPATEIVPFPEKKLRRYVTLAEMPLLAAAIDEDPNEFAGHALWLLLLTGVRRSEILAAKWSDVDWDNGTPVHRRDQKRRACPDAVEPGRHRKAQHDSQIR